MLGENSNSPNSNCTNHSNSSASGSNEIPGRTVAHWSLSTLMIWVSGPVACMFVANQIFVGRSFRPLPVSQAIQIGIIATGFLFLFVFLPLWWTFRSTGVRFASRVSVVLVLSLLFACTFTPQFILCGWASIFIVAVFSALLRTKYLSQNPLILSPSSPQERTEQGVGIGTGNVVPINRMGALWASVTMLMTVGLYSLSMELWPSFELTRLREVRAEYPPIDIADRVGRLGVPASSTSLSTDSSQMQLRIQTAYDENYVPFFPHSLALVHDAHFERFVRSPDFGVTRMNPKLIRLWTKPTSAVAAGEAQSRQSGQNLASDDNNHRWTFFSLSSGSSDAAEQLTPAESHVWTFWDFLHPTTLGAVLGKHEFTGFRAHSVTYPQSVLFESERYELEKLELIGLLLHDGPIVYETDGLPNMESIVDGDIATRELNVFESESLNKLRDGEAIVIEREGGLLKMVGALRAIEQCNECHQSKSGEMLGAFSYVFRPSVSSPPSTK